MMLKVPLDTGSNPDVNKRLSNPRLRNWFVGERGVYRVFALQEIAKLQNIKAIHETTYDSGSYIVVTDGQVVRVEYGGEVEHIASIKNSSSSVKIAENQQNEVVIVNSSNAYVYEQKKATFTELGATQGFDLNNPVDVVVLDSMTIIVGGQDKKWSVSSPNNALQFDTNDVQVTDESMGNLTGIEELNNNLFIFGEYGIQRWVPSVERTSYDFPFQIDPNFRSSYGCIATGSIAQGNDVIYFLANNHEIQSLSAQGLLPVSSPGISKEISGYENALSASGSFIRFNGHYFYQLTCDENSWLFTQSTRKWSESDDAILGSVGSAVVTEDGVFNLTNTQTLKACEYISTVVLPPDSTTPFRRVLNAVKLRFVQGLAQPEEPQHIELAISKDNLSWSNSVRREIGLTGQRQANTVWRMNLSAQQFTFRIRYYGSSDLTLQDLTVDIK